MKRVLSLLDLEKSLRYRYCVGTYETWADLNLEIFLRIDGTPNLRSLLIQ